MSDKYTSIEKLNVGYLVKVGGGTAQTCEAARTEVQLVDSILNIHGYRIVSIEIERIPEGEPPRLPLPAATEALIARTQDDDVVPGLNAGTAGQSYNEGYDK